MFGKKYPVLTPDFCGRLNKLQTALEVLSGKPARLGRLDLNTGKGLVGFHGEGTFKITVLSQMRNDLLEFTLGPEESRPLSGFIIATFDESGKFFVINRAKPRMCNPVIKMRWVGYSAVDRWEEPLDIREIQQDANRRGLTLEEHLRRLNIPIPAPRYFKQLKPGDTFVSGDIRWITVASANGGTFAVPLEGDQRGTIVHLSDWAEVKQIA
jgi:hypothetical protein